MRRDLTDDVRALDEYDLRRLMILVRGLLRDRPGPTFEDQPEVRFRLEAVRCGKTSCTRCPHGPYWYAHWREAGRRHRRYIGRDLPPDVRAAVLRPVERPRPPGRGRHPSS